MSAAAEGEAQFIFEGLSEPECKALEVALDVKEAKHFLTVKPKGDAPGGVYGELITGTVIVIAAKLVVPLVAGWLLSKAPPKPRKETIQIALPDGAKITKTIEYSKSTPLRGLTKILNTALGRGDTEDGDTEIQEQNMSSDSSNIVDV